MASTNRTAILSDRPSFQAVLTKLDPMPEGGWVLSGGSAIASQSTAIIAAGTTTLNLDATTLNLMATNNLISDTCYLYLWLRAQDNKTGIRKTANSYYANFNDGKVYTALFDCLKLGLIKQFFLDPVQFSWVTFPTSNQPTLDEMKRYQQLTSTTSFILMLLLYLNPDRTSPQTVDFAALNSWGISESQAYSAIATLENLKAIDITSFNITYEPWSIARGAGTSPAQLKALKDGGILSTVGLVYLALRTIGTTGVIAVDTSSLEKSWGITGSELVQAINVLKAKKLIASSTGANITVTWSTADRPDWSEAKVRSLKPILSEASRAYFSLGLNSTGVTQVINPTSFSLRWGFKEETLLDTLKPLIDAKLIAVSPASLSLTWA
jgi:hypothetical protein